MRKENKKKIPIKGKMDTFQGDRSVVLSRKQILFIKKNPKFGELYLTCIGFYPHAKNHYRKRKYGINEHILIYCISGYGHVKIGDKVHELSPNSYFIIKSRIPHSYWSSDKRPWSIYWIHFSGKRSEYFSELFYDSAYNISSPNSHKDKRISMFTEILTVLESGFKHENLEFCNLTLGSLLASFFFPETYKTANGVSGTSPIDKAIFFMQKNINNSLSVGEIAKHVNLSKSHLSRIFKNNSGSSPIDYFINLKMQEAIRLLSNQNLRVNEVAFNLGYRDPFYFSRLFKKNIGVSPKVFLKMKKK